MGRCQMEISAARCEGRIIVPDFTKVKTFSAASESCAVSAAQSSPSFTTFIFAMYRSLISNLDNMLVAGIRCVPSCCLSDDERIMMHAPEERLTRVKHSRDLSPRFWHTACLTLV